MTNIFNREILYSEECHAKLMDGVNGLADAVASTMGPAGKNVLIKLGLHDPSFTKDGVTVARNIFFFDPVKNAGAEIISNVALRTAQRCGDGTSTATVLARALLTSGQPIVQEHVDSVLNTLRAKAIPVRDKNDWLNTALVSANNDAEIASMIADTIETVGMDGQITIELSSQVRGDNPEGWHGKYLKSEVVSGMSLPKGYSSPYFVTNAQKMITELDSPQILVMDKNLYTMEDILEPLKATASGGKSILIVAREIGGDALQTMLLNKVKNGVKVCAVAASSLSTDFLEDVAIATGASLTEKKLGKAKKVIVYHDKTVIMEGAGVAEEITARCDMLREAKQKERLARLSGGIAVLWVGGATEAEASERRDRVDDALGATRSAIEEGIVAGGGTALYWAGRSLPDGAVKTATEAPIRQILKNAGSGMPLLANGQGYDARRMRSCDMVEAGIIDPVKVVCSAFGDAVSVARLLMNTECAIVEKFSEEKIK